MSQSFRFDQESGASPFASRRNAMRSDSKGERFAARRLARLASHKAQALADLDAPAARD